MAVHELCFLKFDRLISLLFAPFAAGSFVINFKPQIFFNPSLI